MTDFYPVYVYIALVTAVVLLTLGVSTLFPSIKTSPAKFLPYESGNLIDTNLLQERFPLRHYLVGLIFLVMDVEVIFLFPWAVVGKELGAFAFYEMIFFLGALLVGFAYVWRKGGLKWE